MHNLHSIWHRRQSTKCPTAITAFFGACKQKSFVRWQFPAGIWWKAHFCHSTGPFPPINRIFSSIKSYLFSHLLCHSWKSFIVRCALVGFNRPCLLYPLLDMLPTQKQWFCIASAQQHRFSENNSVITSLLPTWIHLPLLVSHSIPMALISNSKYLWINLTARLFQWSCAPVNR